MDSPPVNIYIYVYVYIYIYGFRASAVECPDVDKMHVSGSLGPC